MDHPPTPVYGGPSLWASAPAKTREGAPIPLTVTLQAPDAGGFSVARLQPWMIRVDMRDQHGRPVQCHVAPMPKRMPIARDFVRLGSREQLTLNVDLAQACARPPKGKYTVSVSLDIPGTWAGQRQRLQAWVGSVSAEAIPVHVRRNKRN